MGPLASAEFLRTIYQFAVRRYEQDTPRILLDSDPSIPDRTESLFNGNHDRMLIELTDRLCRLRDQNVSTIVICCMTIHHLLPRVPADLRSRVLSLLDVTIDAIVANRERYLLACTIGVREFELFERHPRWDRVKDSLVLPNEDDQKKIHDLIYRLKGNQDPDAVLDEFVALLRKYEVDAFVAGCTEIHLLSRRLLDGGGIHGVRKIIDPLIIIAEQIASGRLRGHDGPGPQLSRASGVLHAPERVKRVP